DNNALKVHNQCRFDPPNDAIIPLLEQCGFGYVVRLRKCMLDAHLITAMLVEEMTLFGNNFHDYWESIRPRENMDILLGQHG
ncbi:hypothetical protein L195_g055705, partial [Trifolium pratense]